MKLARRLMPALAALALVFAAGDTGPRDRAWTSAEAAIRSWPAPSRALAGAMLEKYGAPDEIVASQLGWNDRRPWTRIVAFRDPKTVGGADVLLQSVAYGRVPFTRWRALSAFGHGTAYDPVKQELDARTEGETANILALNLADEVARGRRTPEDARAFFDRTVSLSLSGKSSPYTTRLLFAPAGGSSPSR